MECKNVADDDDDDDEWGYADGLVGVWCISISQHQQMFLTFGFGWFIFYFFCVFLAFWLNNQTVDFAHNQKLRFAQYIPIICVFEIHVIGFCLIRSITISRVGVHACMQKKKKRDTVHPETDDFSRAPPIGWFNVYTLARMVESI